MTPSARPRPWPGRRPGHLRGPRVDVADQQSAVAVDVAHLAELARGVLADRGVARGELTLSFVDQEAIAELNRQYLDGDGPTDVLAFPLDAGTGDGGTADVPVLLGDVVVCPEVAQRNAGERSVATGDELALLVVHGVLHVLGMDHAEPGETARMQAAEGELLARHHHHRHLWRIEVAERPRSSTNGPNRGQAGEARVTGR